MTEVSPQSFPETVSSPRRFARTGYRIALIVAGTTAALVLAGFLFQWLRAREGEAQVTTNERATGRAVIRDDTPLARVVVGNGPGRLITYDQVARECVERYGEEVLENLINRTIIQMECERRGIEISRAEVDQEVMRIAKRFQQPVDTWYQWVQANQGLSPRQYREDRIWPLLALKKLAGAQAEITEDDLRKAFVRDYGPRVKAKVIVLDNLRRAKAVWQKVMETRDPSTGVVPEEEFERLAREFSIDPNSRALGGDVPPIPRYAGNEELEKAAFRLRKGEVSGIVQIGYNRYAILRCQGRTEPIVDNIDEVRDRLYEDLVEQRVQESVAKVFQQLKEQARVDNYLTNTSTAGRSSTRTADGENAGGPIRQTSGTRQR